MGEDCLPGADKFIEHWFRDCIYNFRDYVGFSVGLASIGCWSVSQFPQLYKNYKTQSAEALSPWFIAEWLLGDTCNLLGCLLRGDQLPTAVWTAQYFIAMDVLMLLQFLYYTLLQKQTERTFTPHHHHYHHHTRHHHHHHHRRRRRPAAESIMGDQDQSESLTNDPSSSYNTISRDSTVRGIAIGASFASIVVATLGYYRPSAPHPPILFDVQGRTFKDVRARLGTSFGYASSIFYLTARVSQLYKNARRQSAQGLAMSMFLCAIGANFLYGLAILLRARDLADVIISAPWLLGSLGTMLLDVGILLQSRVLGRRGDDTLNKNRMSDAEEPLLITVENEV